jgi:hypothetical protein
MKEIVDSLSQEVIDLLFDDTDVFKVESKKIFEDFSGGINNYINFSRGLSDIQKWVEDNRVIYGKRFSYESADIELMLSTKDKENLKLNSQGFLETAPRPYLKQYLNDKGRDKSVIKCRQSEFTENEINENIFLCISRPYTNVRHIFPTTGMAQRISKEKISPALEKSSSIAGLLKKPYNLTSKGFLNGSFYTVDSSWTDYQGRGPSSDKLTFDEYESQNPHIEDIFSESTSHSSLGKKVRISTPKFPNSGIDEMFNRGSQYEWHITCPKCKKEQILTFPDNIINFFEIGAENITSESYQKKLDKVYIGCRFCGTYIDKTSKHYVSNSRWIPRAYNLILTRVSYRVTYMMLAWKTGKEILYKYHTFKFLHQFWNEIMGYAYVDLEAKITRSVFEECQTHAFVNSYHSVSDARNVSVGVDWGNISWVVVRANGFNPYPKKPRIIYVERIDAESLKKRGYTGIQTDHAKRVAEIFIFFRGKILVNDANGIGVDRNSYLIRKFPTRAYGCFYDTQDNQKQRLRRELLTPKWNEKARTVTVSRVASLKEMIREYEEKQITIPKIDPDVSEFIDHHANLAVEKYEDEKTSQIYEVVGHIGPDHYSHADNYAKIGFERMVNIDKTTTPGVISSAENMEEIVEVFKRNTEEFYEPGY